MKNDEPVMVYLRSRLNTALLAGAGCVAVLGAVLAGPLGRLLVPLAAVVGYLGITVLVLQSRRGAAAIVAARTDDRARDAAASVRASAATRDRLAVLRIADGKVRKALEYFLQVSGEYLEACRRAGTYSPLASGRIDEVLAMMQIYLEKLDGASTDEEYGLADAAGVAGARAGSAEDAARRLHEAAAYVKECMASDLAILPADVRQGIMDELEGKP